MNDALELVQDTLYIGGSTYKIVLKDAAWREHSESAGLVDVDRMEVCVSVGQTPSEFLNTLIHELSHVIWREWNLPGRPREERAVTAMGYGWTALYKQNAWLLEVFRELRDID